MKIKRIKKQWQGMRANRYPGNPLERQFALVWQEENDRRIGEPLVEYLLSSDPNCPSVGVSDRDVLVANTIIQWLGTPVGQGFLAEVLHSHAGQRFLNRTGLKGKNSKEY